MEFVLFSVCLRLSVGACYSRMPANRTTPTSVLALVNRYQITKDVSWLLIRCPHANRTSASGHPKMVDKPS